MASGHVNRIKRPNTWLHRPMLQNVKKLLPNRSRPHMGAERKWSGASRVCKYPNAIRETPPSLGITEPQFDCGFEQLAL